MIQFLRNQFPKSIFWDAESPLALTTQSTWIKLGISEKKFMKGDMKGTQKKNISARGNPGAACTNPQRRTANSRIFGIPESAKMNVGY